MIAWESVDGSAVQATGLMRFSPLSPTETRLDLSLTYLPRSTNLTEAFAALLTGRNGDRIRTELASASRTLGERKDAAAHTASRVLLDAPGSVDTPAEAAL